MGFLAPKPPPMPAIPTPPPAAHPATLASTSNEMLKAQRNAEKIAASFDNTLKSTPQGAGTASTAKPSLVTSSNQGTLLGS